MKDFEKKACFSSNSEEWETPQDLFELLDHKWGFTLDVCATEKNAKCEKYFTKEQNGLEQLWHNEICWMNPPYGRNIKNWIKKAYYSSYLHGATVIGLLPARTCTKWFHDYIYKKANIEFIKGRLRFSDAKENAPFPSMIVEWKF